MISNQNIRHSAQYRKYRYNIQRIPTGSSSRCLLQIYCKLSTKHCQTSLTCLQPTILSFSSIFFANVLAFAVVKNKIYLHLKHLHLSRVSCRHHTLNIKLCSASNNNPYNSLVTQPSSILHTTMQILTPQ